MPPLVLTVLAGLALAVWVYLVAGHGRFWSTRTRLPPAPTNPTAWPSVVAVIPARDEADVLPRSLPTVVGQDYAGSFRVVVVDDDSGDARAEVVRADGPPPGWVGKVAAIAHGVAAAGAPDYLLFTDADVAYPRGSLTRLVAAATAHDLVLTSQMVRLRCESRGERWIIPAFVYFFAQLYPFRRVNAAGRTAAAAGGCMLVRRETLDQAGGLERIHDALIDDVALGRLLKPHGRIWLGLSDEITSIRPHRTLAGLWLMITRSAYTQLRHSPLLLLATIAGLMLTYVVPPAAAIVGLSTREWATAALGVAGWSLIAASFVPMLRFYRLGPLRAVALPAIAVLYALMTLDSARRHHRGRGGTWKGRVRAGQAA
jgi:hopene-associated glycosyltransferase HpnB